jgi:flagellar M-ring protein FliF
MASEVISAPAPSGMPAGLKPILLLIGIAAAVAVGVTVVLWSRGPSFSLLYNNLAAEDQAAVAQALDAAQIPYRLQPGSSSIEVPVERLSEARLKLAGQGLPEGGGGFAAVDKDPGFGVSQFVENARYQHALESELARTIANLKPVDGARVHLAVPRQSAFVRDHEKPSASVFVQLKQGRRLEQEQVQAIVNLVASSIPDMEASQVTVVDQQGRLLSSPEGHDELSLREKQFDLVHRLEDDYVQRIETLLTPLVGPGRVRAQVVAQMDMSTTEEAREQYRPDSQIVRSEQSSEQMNRDGSGPQGVPGALTNQPPPAGVALASSNTPPKPADADASKATPGAGTKTPAGTEAVAGTSAAAGAAETSSSKQSTRNYEIDRTVAYTRQPAGKLHRLTVAVLIDNLHTTSKDGKPAEVALSQPQLEHITQLVKDAVGFDESRGDAVNVVNQSFTPEAPMAEEGDLEKPPIWESPLFQELAKLVAGAIVLLVLVLSVLRPLVRNLMGSARAAALAHAPAAAAPSQALVAERESAKAVTHEVQVAQARSLAGQDPKRVAQVVRGWVNQDE